MSRDNGVPVNQANRFAHIDALRAFAVVVVVLGHAGLGSIVPGGSGVTIFFSVSGFIITYLVLREMDKSGNFSARGFYVRRVVKIAPPLVLLVALPTLVYAIWNTIDVGAFLAQIFFVFNWLKVDGIPNVLPGSGVVWSLAIEEQFYIVFALLWLVAVKTRHARSLLAVFAGLSIVWSMSMRFVLAVNEGNEHRIYYGSDTRLDGIAWGVLAAIGYHAWVTNGQRPTKISRAIGNDWTLITAIVLFISSLAIRDEWFRDTLRFSFQSVAACLIILYGQVPGRGNVRHWFTRAVTWRPVAIIGLSSYSIYLAHLSIANLLGPLLGELPVLLSGAAKILIGIGVGITVYYLLERPAHLLRIRREAARTARRQEQSGSSELQRLSQP
jgi:peptidoglycan/LPS O-acetylase OafA/YrhL